MIGDKSADGAAEPSVTSGNDAMPFASGMLLAKATEVTPGIVAIRSRRLP